MSETSPRLNRALLEQVRSSGAEVSVPDAALMDLPERAVQFGTGAFLRGFVDDFIHRANQQGRFNGRIVAVSSMGRSRDRALREQDGLYTLAVEGIERGERVQERRIISSLSRALSAADEWPDVLELARLPGLECVFSNTTEVGIINDEESGPEDAPPRSFPAKLTRFLYERASCFAFDPSRGLTIIPCELIKDNGSRLREIVHRIAARWELPPAFTEWIDNSVPFCNTLVDRIVPGTPREENARRLQDALGYDDALLTCCEPYRLFAIEGGDALRNRLSWAAADPGIVIAADIEPYRTRKVHLLNGAHSVLACAALAMECETVRDAITHPALGRFVQHAMTDEIVPMLDVDGAEEFAEDVLDRFENPFIRHALIDITLQATMKMRVRVVPIIERYVTRRESVPQSLAFGFAAWLLFMRGTVQKSRQEQGLSVPVDDQGMRLAAHWAGDGDDPASPVAHLVRSVLADASLWGTDLTALPDFAESVSDHLSRMQSDGMSEALEHHLASTVE